MFYCQCVQEIEHQEQCPIKELQIELVLPPLQKTKPLCIYSVPKEMQVMRENYKQKERFITRHMLIICCTEHK